MTAVTEAYYREFAKRNGFADSAMRGHGHALVLAAPIYKAPAQNGHHGPAAYCAISPDRDEIGTRRDRQIDFSHRMRARDREIAEHLSSLSGLVEQVRLRIQVRPHRAAREALADAEKIAAGRHPLRARGDKLEVLRSLVRILQRYA